MKYIILPYASYACLVHFATAISLLANLQDVHVYNLATKDM